MEKKYVRCPYCGKKTLRELQICSNCERLLPSEIKDTVSIKRIVMLIFIVLLVVAFYYINNGRKKIKEVDVIKGFSDIAKDIKYNSDYNEDKLIFVSNDNIIKVMNTKGKIVMDDVSSLEEDCNNFYIITKRKDNIKYYYIIDNKGKVLYKDSKRIYYYPKHNNFLIGKTLYFNNKKVANNIELDNNMDYSGDYFSFKKDNYGGIVDYKGEKKYEVKITEFFYLESASKREMLEKNYCVVNKDYQYGIIDCETGILALNYNTRKIEELSNNIFKVKNVVFYIDSNRNFIFYDKEPNEVDYTYKYFINNKLLLGTRLMNTNDSISDSNVVTSSKIETDNNIETILCKDVSIHYGMKVNYNDVLPCEYNSISFFNNSIYDYMNKVYVILNKNNNISLYDVKNDKYINNVEMLSDSSPLIVYKDNDNRYIYNLKTDDNKILKENDKITIYDNHYVIETIDVDNMKSNKDYYGLDLEKIDIE